MKKIVYLALFILSLASCIKDAAPSPSLKVTVDKTEYKAGDTVTFRFEGTPDNIVFYSGEPGHEYAQRHNYTRTGSLFFEFTSCCRYGQPSTEPNFSVLVSADFDGVYDLQHVSGANWIELDGITLSQYVSGGSAIFTPSGEADINAALEAKGIVPDAEDGIYFAFRYHDGRPLNEPNQWLIRSTTLEIQSQIDGTRSPLAYYSEFGWKEVPEDPETNVNVTSNQILMRGDGADEELWVISAPFSAGSTDADKGVPVKSIATALEEYTYVYDEPGTYTAVFESSSVWYTGGGSALTQVTVNVVE